MARETERGRAKDRKREGRIIVNHISYEGGEGEKWSIKKSKQGRDEKDMEEERQQVEVTKSKRI